MIIKPDELKKAFFAVYFYGRTVRGTSTVQTARNPDITRFHRRNHD